MRRLRRIWDSKLTLVVLVAAYAAVEFYGYWADMKDDRRERVRSEVAEKVGADLREQSRARRAKLMQDLKALAPPTQVPAEAPGP